MAAVARFSGFVWKLVAYSQGGERLLADVPVDRVGDGGRRSAGGGCRLPNRQGRRSTIRSCLEHEGGVACPVNQLLYMTLRPRRTMRRGVALCSGVLAFVLLTAEASSCGSTPSATSSSAASTTPGSFPPVSSAPKATFVTFGGGSQIVGTDIRAGTYRTRHNSSGCYMARLKGFSGELSDIIANDNSDGPVVVTILKTDKGFDSSNCDTWTSDLSQITVANKATFGGGDFIVPTDILAGTYRSPAPASGNCYWARLRGFSHQLKDIIANGNTDKSAIVTVSARDKGFESSGCGTWTKIK